MCVCSKFNNMSVSGVTSTASGRTRDHCDDGCIMH